MAKIFLILLTLLSFTSCKKELVSQVQPQTPYELWRSQNLHDYSIDQVRTCYCPDGGVVVRVTVRSDTIFSLTKVADGSLVTSPYYFTVDSLFGMIEYGNFDSLVVRYNSIYGYPEFLDLNPQWHPVDGGVLYETTNLKKE
ncbi:MAG: DUF6174 domain-containing protein [Ignavibacteria bacterium]|nr:DUF6174 domain-containing protein [Ignavibacteria bacterium]